MTIIKCPKCAQTLPGNAPRCHFCGDDLKAVARPVVKTGPAPRLAMATAPPWVWYAYYAVSAYIALSGVAGIVQAFSTTHQLNPFTQEPLGFTPGNVVAMVFGLFSVIMGIGLAMKVELFRGIANFFCGMRILFGGFSILVTLPLILVLGVWGALLFFLSVLDVATAAFMIYLIGETD